MLSRINRYIMECKCYHCLKSLKVNQRINRYIMECKFKSVCRNRRIYCELIDTLWNVNSCDDLPYIIISWINRYIMECKCFISNYCINTNAELIDTLWNVNHETGQWAGKRTRGINRYIMECKFSANTLDGDLIFELIDTLWNVNICPDNFCKCFPRN